jgi:hypothetical protein
VCSSDLAAVEAEVRWDLSQRQMLHPVGEQTRVQLRDAAVDRVVVWEIVRQVLASAGRALTPAEIDATVAADRARMGDMFPKYIAMLGQDEASYRRRGESIQNFKRYRREYVEPGFAVTEEEIAAHYAKDEGYRAPESFRVTALKIASADAQGRLMHGDLGAVAGRARGRLAEGASFDQVATEVTRTQTTGSVEASVVYKAGDAPFYEPTLRRLKPGEFSQPLQVTANSYVIFRLDGHDPAKSASLDDARPQIRVLLLEQKVDAALRSRVAELKKKAEIRYVDPQFQPWQ